MSGSFGVVLDFNEAQLNWRGLAQMLEKHQFVVIRNASIDVNQLVELTCQLGEIEPAWEDAHTSNEYVQHMDSRLAKKILSKSSSKYWHLDRSHMAVPTRYTILHAEYAEQGARGTQIGNARAILSSLPRDIRMEIEDKRAVHEYSLNFPKISLEKGVSDAEVNRKQDLYPKVLHPLVRHSTFGDALYFSELCVSQVEDLSEIRSAELIAELRAKTEYCSAVYEHNWQTNDLLIWDNFSTIHRASSAASNATRVLNRTTVRC